MAAEEDEQQVLDERRAIALWLESPAAHLTIYNALHAAKPGTAARSVGSALAEALRARDREDRKRRRREDKKRRKGASR